MNADAGQLIWPADIETALARTDWQHAAGWPVGLAETNRICADQLRAGLTWARQCERPLIRDAALLAMPVVLAYGRAIVLAALALSRAAKRGIRIEGRAPELNYLKDGEGPVPVRTDPVLPPAKFGLSYARRVARVRSWTPVSRMPRALTFPHAVAISHNSLLRTVAREGGQVVGFRHAEIILDGARRKAPPPPELNGTARDLAAAIAGIVPLDEPYRQRALTLIAAVAQNHLSKAARDLTALQSVSLPAEVWTGSGGLYAPRAIGLEVLRRGGRVRRFDHGMPRGFVDAPGITDLLETSVSSEFVLATEGAAQICRKEMAEIPESRRVAISGAQGDPIFRRVPMHGRRRRGGRPRVVYAPTQLLGFRQLVPALPPDPVHLDWQMQLAQFLNGLQVDFVCQAHPEGLFHNRQHPLEAVVPTKRGNFRAQLEEADVFVFDYPSTTALWECACTDARIVFLDVSAGRMAPDIARLFEERATVLPVTHGEDHRMSFDADALREAVLANTGAADPSAFRRLLAGAA